MFVRFDSTVRSTDRPGTGNIPVTINMDKVCWLEPSADGVATIIHFGGVGGDYVRVETEYRYLIGLIHG